MTTFALGSNLETNRTGNFLTMASFFFLFFLIASVYIMSIIDLYHIILPYQD